MPANTTFSPIKNVDLANDILKPNLTGLAFTAGANGVTDFDYKILDDMVFLGAKAILSGHVFGDKMTVQVVDKDGIISPAGTVLFQPITDWFFASDVQSQEGSQLPYPAKIITNLYIRVKYTSVGLLVNVGVKINCFMHKVLA